MDNTDLKHEVGGYTLADIERLTGKVIGGNSSLNRMPVLHYFAMFDYCDLFREMMAKGADINRKDMQGYSVLYSEAGARKERNQTFELILSFSPDVNLKNRGGETALHFAVAQGFQDRVEILLNHGADVSIKNNEGLNAIDLAIKYSNSEIEQILTGYRKSKSERLVLDGLIECAHNEECGIRF